MADEAEVKEGQALEKTVGNTMTANKLHGINGLFSTPGLERDVITAMVRPQGIGSVLPALPSTTEDPRYPSITGFTDVVGSEPTTSCADAPYGYMKGCNLTARFGLARRDTNVIDITKVNLKTNRGEMNDLILRGKLLGMENLSPRGISDADAITILTKSEMVGVGVQFERLLSRQLWQGTTAIANQFPGLDAQIVTGQKDADSGTTCPALDSDVKDFAWDLVGGTGRSIVEYVSMMGWYLNYNAVGMGLDPVKWVIAMRPELWFELSAVWPCQYLSHRCNIDKSATNPIVINDNVNVAMRDQMRRDMVLPVNGINYPVVVDTGIYEYNNTTNANCAAGQYASSLYFVPLTIQGNFPVTYREYLDYGMADRDISLLNGTETFWTDGGMYSWAVEYNKWCFHLAARTEQRVILRTPQLAGKIQRIKYTPLQHLRSEDPASSYFADGGVSLRGYTRGQAVWGN